MEATDDQGAVIGLMRHHIVWGNKESEWPVYIDRTNSISSLLDHVYLRTIMKSSGLKILGVIFDADDKFESRWTSLREFCKSTGFNDVPERPNKTGLILQNGDGQKFGAWIMPNNSSHGMLETFCAALIPNNAGGLWQHAMAAFKAAREMGAPCKEVHLEKAHIHTWLAWQDPPGERMGTALTRKILDPGSETARLFVEWFMKLYELEPRPAQ